MESVLYASEMSRRDEECWLLKLLLNQAVDKDHDRIIALRYLDLAERLRNVTGGIQFIQSPYYFRPSHNCHTEDVVGQLSQSMTQLGYADESVFERLILGWQAIMEAFSVTKVIAVDCPAAVLAAELMGLSVTYISDPLCQVFRFRPCNDSNQISILNETLDRVRRKFNLVFKSYLDIGEELSQSVMYCDWMDPIDEGQEDVHYLGVAASSDFFSKGKYTFNNAWESGGRLIFGLSHACFLCQELNNVLSKWNETAICYVDEGMAAIKLENYACFDFSADSIVWRTLKPQDCLITNMPWAIAEAVCIGLVPVCLSTTPKEAFYAAKVSSLQMTSVLNPRQLSYWLNAYLEEKSR